jgi:F-type H+-transporting ATPase subunit gamma
MATLQDIKRRLRSVENTKQITGAMEMVSAAKLRRAQTRVTAARPYAAKLAEIMENLAGVASGLAHPLFEARAEKTVGLIVVTGSKGLCGSYNSAVIRRAEAWLKGRSKESVRLYCVGRRGNDYFAKRGWTIVGYWPDVNDLSGAESSGRVASAVIKSYLNNEVDAVYLLYTRFINAMSRAITLDKLLNIEPPAERATSGNYIFEPDPAAILGVLPERYVATRLLAAFLESAASEHGARMIAMGSASRNATELISALVLQRNRARQAAITKEIAEIVGGAEALK